MATAISAARKPVLNSMTEHRSLSVIGLRHSLLRLAIDRLMRSVVLLYPAPTFAYLWSWRRSIAGGDRRNSVFPCANAILNCIDAIFLGDF
jgi:hypothetical protein